MGNPARQGDASTGLNIARVERAQAQSDLSGPYATNAAPLTVSDSLASLHREYRPRLEPSAVVHVIYPFQQKKRAVVHY
jgi:hypothetical protein